MRFTKYNNPNKKRKHYKKPIYSKEYIENRKNEMYSLLASAKTEEEKDAIIKAFNISIRPY